MHIFFSFFLLMGMNTWHKKVQINNQNAFQVHKSGYMLYVDYAITNQCCTIVYY